MLNTYWLKLINYTSNILVVEYEVHYEIDYGFGLEHRWMFVIAESPEDAKKKVSYDLNYKHEYDFSELKFHTVYTC